jgi:Tol biopolymer transport system component
MVGLCLGSAIDDQSSASDAAAKSEARYVTNITQLTSTSMGLLNAGEAYFSPDGKTIIFQGTPLGETDYQIYTLDLQTRKLKMVSTGKGACTCAFFRPDGRKIIFASSHLGPDHGQIERGEDAKDYKWFFNEHMDIFEADLDGSNLRRLTDTVGYDAEGAYSPDGKRIVFTSKRDGDLEVYLMDADGGNPRRLTNAGGYDGGSFFSPDGKTILYRADRRNDGKMNLQIRMVDPDGTSDRAITDNPIFNWCPFWYPSGKCFVFTQVDHAAWSKGARPNYDLFMMTVDGGKLTRITFDRAFDGLPAFSANGQRLLWTSQRGNLPEPQIFIADFKLPSELE